MAADLGDEDAQFNLGLIARRRDAEKYNAKKETAMDESDDEY